MVVGVGLLALGWTGSGVAAPPSVAEKAQLRAYVDNLYDRQAVRHRFTQPSGAEVDCVDILAQPGLRHGAEKHLATPPPQLRQLDDATAPGLADLAGTEAVLNAGTKNAAGEELACPDGTIPLQRLPQQALDRMQSVDALLRKYPGDAHRRAQGHIFEDTDETALRAYGPTSLHQYAHAAQYNLANRGANVTINVWNPYVQVGSEFSLGQLWVVKGSGTGLQTLEAGVQKYVNLYGNYNPHLFIYSTSNGYGNQGCYNLQCGRFIQVNSSVVIGGNLSPVSTSGGTQYEVQMAYYLWQGNWWFQFQGIWVGYYPGSLFNAAGLANGASVIDFGGEIIDDRSKHSYHTFTDMGSGRYPSAWYGKAAYMRNIYYWDAYNNAYWATGIIASRTNAYCYDIAVYHNDVNWHTYFFYGGPGYNVNCQ
jgi:hypothetical protein